MNSPETDDRNRWTGSADFISSLDEHERNALTEKTGVPFPQEADGILAALEASGATDGSPSDFFALVGVRVAMEDGDREISGKLGRAALQLARSVEEKQLAHACLAQTAFKFRKDERSLATFEENCEAAIRLGHAGTFCYERLAVLYEYRGDAKRAIEVCRNAEAALSAAGDGRSAQRFREKAGAIEGRREKSLRKVKPKNAGE